MLDEKFQRNASKFSIFYIYEEEKKHQRVLTSNLCKIFQKKTIEEFRIKAYFFGPIFGDFRFKITKNLPNMYYSLLYALAPDIVFV